jgi:CubicO group peptidase (beta-lactamase class C family)
VTANLLRSSPAAENLSPDRLAGFVDAAGRFGGIDSVMVLRHGRVVAERWWPPASPTEPHVLWSVSKSFTSTAVGLAIDEGRFAIDDWVIDLLPDDIPEEIGDHLAAMTVRHLLTMTSGHAAESLPDDEREQVPDWTRWVLEQPVPLPPGGHFVYNSGATYLLSAIVQRHTGENLLRYLTPRLFAPLGIRGSTWETSPQGIDCGGWGLSATTEDVAAFGQLYLRRGEWNGEQLVPTDWVDAATSWQVATEAEPERPDWRQGYGYLFWRCRHNAYRADGKDGQFCIILPEADVVVTMTAQLTDMQGELALVWDHLLPAIG